MTSRPNQIRARGFKDVAQMRECSRTSSLWPCREMFHNTLSERRSGQQKRKQQEKDQEKEWRRAREWAHNEATDCRRAIPVLTDDEDDKGVDDVMIVVFVFVCLFGRARCLRMQRDRWS